ncbi:MAG: hypothetical protein R3F11_29400 [Verrucomicrobiales bacterium]
MSDFLDPKTDQAPCFPVLAIFASGQVRFLNDLEPLRYAPVDDIRQRAYDGLEIFDSAARRFRLVGWFADGEVNFLARLLAWVFPPESSVHLTLAKPEPPDLEAMRGQLLEAAYRSPDYFETTFLLDVWVEKISAAESAAEMIGLFAEFEGA